MQAINSKMMNNSSAGDDKGAITSKLETSNNENETNDNDKLSKALARAASFSSAAATTTTSRQWAGFKNPRIVRVSRTFGGKDRHSKVCTIRGLRDRRIRLSVPTAIQLYDLQDRLNLSQPSKVIDWLLDATKLDIDKLPPLQIPPGSFVDFHQQSLFGQLGNNLNPPPYLDANLALMKNDSSSMMNIPTKEGININDDVDVDVDEDEDEEEDDRSMVDTKSGSVQSFFPMAGPNNGFFPTMPYNNMYHWDPSNLSLSQFGGHGSNSVPSQDDSHMNNFNSSGTPQLFFCPSLATTSLFPQHDNRFHLSSSYGTGSGMRDFDNNAGHQQDKDHHGN